MRTFVFITALFLVMSSTDANGQAESESAFAPSPQSIDAEEVPDAFRDAKLGLFVNWGLYSVPAWATTDAGELGEVDDRTWFEYNSYAEWYWNSMRIAGSPTAEHHKEVWGEDFKYEDFAPLFKEAIQEWNPEEWADLFKEVGARYVVFDTKHHDGFLLWPSSTPNPHMENWQVDRDLPGELGEAVRERGMDFGVYYSGGIDWSFSPVVVEEMADLQKAVPESDEYAAYATEHYRELIQRYQPSVLWNDISFPQQAPIPKLFAEYYDEVPDGVINDRWGSIEQLAERIEADTELETNRNLLYDFTTPEYHVFPDITDIKWEATRGLGLSFGYNQSTRAEHMLSVKELVHLFVDIVSKNGNLLLNVGPAADGTIPELQLERLREFGDWLSVNGEAIFETRPWVVAEGITENGTEVRFTEKKGTVYATLFDEPQGDTVTIRDFFHQEGGEVQLLGYEGPLAWQQNGGNLEIEWPQDVESSPALVLKLSPQPWKLQQK